MSKQTSIDPSDINRRQFLAVGSGLSFSLAMGSAMLPMGTSAQTNDARMAINVWYEAHHRKQCRWGCTICSKSHRIGHHAAL